MTESFHSRHTPEYRCPVARGSLRHTLAVPGSKSLTNRELVLSALAEGPSILHAPLHARDTALMRAALETLGATITEVAGSSQFGPDLHIAPIPHRRPSAGVSLTIDCGLAGTVMRFVPPVAALGSSQVRFEGDGQASARPMAAIIEALRSLGHDVDDDDTGTLPFTLTPHPARTPTRPVVRLDASSSSQFVSALLLAAPKLPYGLTIEHTGKTLPSLPHIDMTIDTLLRRGVTVSRPQPHIFDVAPQTISQATVAIEPDLSNAAPFLAAALVAGGEVSVSGWPETTTQVGRLVPEILSRFGASTNLHDMTLTVKADGVSVSPLPPVSLDLHDAGELAPTFIALSVLGDGPSRFHGIAHLRGHETNRLHALVSNIEAIGGRAEETDDGIIVTPQPLTGGVWRAFGDHRMATSGALIGLAVPGVVVDDIGQTAKTLPEFVDLWEAMVGSAP